MIYTADEHSEPILLYEEAVMFKGLYCGGHLGPFVLGCVLACTLGSAFALAITEEDASDLKQRRSGPEEDDALLIGRTISYKIDFDNQTIDRWLLVVDKTGTSEGTVIPPVSKNSYNINCAPATHLVCTFTEDPNGLFEAGDNCRKQFSKKKELDKKKSCDGLGQFQIAPPKERRDWQVGGAFNHEQIAPPKERRDWLAAWRRQITLDGGPYNYQISTLVGAHRARDPDYNCRSGRCPEDYTWGPLSKDGKEIIDLHLFFNYENPEAYFDYSDLKAYFDSLYPESEQDVR